MQTVPSSAPLNIESRLSRSQGRTGRTFSANVRLTRAELTELESKAAAEQKAVGEWAREVLLREARRAHGDPLFTEIIATRTLLINLIRPLIFGKKVTEEWVTEAMAVVRREKHKAAEEVLQQYAGSAAERR